MDERIKLYKNQEGVAKRNIGGRVYCCLQQVILSKEMNIKIEMKRYFFRYWGFNCPGKTIDEISSGTQREITLFSVDKGKKADTKS
jgi:hypothetical protein